MFCRTYNLLLNNIFLKLNLKKLKDPCIQYFHKYKVFTNIDTNAVSKYISHLEDEYIKLNEMKYKNQKIENRLTELNPIMRLISEKNLIKEHLSNLTDLLQDNNEEIRELAQEEETTYKERLIKIEDELLEAIIPIDTRDNCRSIVLEINAGVGGQEAMLFANELLNMYINFTKYKGWTTEIVELDETDLGGIRHASVFINGKHVYQFFKHEAGVHRVQRVPATEKSGRIHTSTVSVFALPQPREIDIKIDEKDLRIETKRASGAGGQHVNTTDSAVRIMHLPTGVTVECQVDRSQIKNKEIAMKKLRAMLFERERNMQTQENLELRKLQVNTNFRNEKIRTYNYSQDRITDHRLQTATNIHNMKEFLSGSEQLDSLIHKLHSVYQNKILSRILSSIREPIQKSVEIVNDDDQPDNMYIEDCVEKKFLEKS